MTAHSADQGRIARLAVFWSLAVLIYHGCTSLRETLASSFEALKRPLASGFPKLPVIGVELTGAFLIALVVFAGGLFLVWRWEQREKTAVLMAETETELRKVTWPTGHEVFTSSVVVVVCVAFLMAFLAGADWVLGRVAGLVLFGRA